MREELWPREIRDEGPLDEQFPWLWAADVAAVLLLFIAVVMLRLS